MPVTTQTIQLLEPDDDLLVATSSGSTDASLQESGTVDLQIGQTSVTVAFAEPKLSEQYIFEALYVAELDLDPVGDIEAVPRSQTKYGFTVGLVGTPDKLGYQLVWRVVIRAGVGTVSVGGIDAPDGATTQLPQAQSVVITFASPRSTTTYGFSEFRVQNLVDATRFTVWPQISAKTTTNFTVDLNPAPDTNNYFLVWRTP